MEKRGRILYDAAEKSNFCLARVLACFMVTLGVPRIHASRTARVVIRAGAQ